MNSQLIISAQDFRRLTGDATAHFTDKQVEEIIQQLDFLAEMYIRQVRGEAADELEDKE